MLLREVGYARPKSLAEAIDLLAAHDGARALAGGQTLINVMKARAGSPDALVDLNAIEELKAIELGADGTLELGAMATYTDIIASSEARARPIIGQGGERTLSASEFFLGVYLTAVGPGEVLTKITVPAGRGDGFAAVTLGVEGTCIASAAASVNGSITVALGCVDAVPVVVHPASAGPDDVRAAVQGANLEPPSDVHASAAYRTHLAQVLA